MKYSKQICFAVVLLIIWSTTACFTQTNKDNPKQFRLWGLSDPHVFSDIYLRQKTLMLLDPEGKYLPHESGVVPRRNARESIGVPILQSESEDGFEWDIAIMAGDFSGSHDLPVDREGEEIVKQFGNLSKHKREDIYSICGNHDASPGNQWFQKWIDPMGKNTEFSGVNAGERPYQVEGTYERYSFRVGNILFLMMSDRNDFPPPVGCIVGDKGTGGHPPGAVLKSTFEWWKDKVLSEPEESIIISVHHHMLKETTIGSGEWEGYKVGGKAPHGVGEHRYHGYMAEDGEHNKGAGYLYWLIDDSQSPMQPVADAQVFEKFLTQHPGAIDLWIGGHTHTFPDGEKAGRTHFAKKWGVNFINVGALSINHGGDSSEPLSRLMTFTEGSTQLGVQCYMHTDRYAPIGWYKPAEKMLTLQHPFHW